MSLHQDRLDEIDARHNLQMKHGFHYTGNMSHLEYALAMGRTDEVIKTHIHDGKIEFETFVIRSCCNTPIPTGTTRATVHDENDLKNAKFWIKNSFKGVPQFDTVAIKFRVPPQEEE
jgi:hypothetical protein